MAKEKESKLKVVAATYELPVRGCTRVLATVEASGKKVTLGPENVYEGSGVIDEEYRLDLNADEMDGLIEGLKELRGLMED